MTSCDALLPTTERCVDTEPLFVGPCPTCVCTPLACKRNAAQLKRCATAAPTTADRPQAPSAPPPLCR
eukprot:3786363-Pyramimonas_sp.AAC.2